MTSTNSLNSNRFFPMFKTVFKRNIAFFIVVQIFSALYAFFIPRLILKSVAEMSEYMEAGFQENVTTGCIWTMSLFLFVAGTLWVFILAVSLFREIYSKRASVFYFSMPVKRGIYFNVNLLYGVITVFVSYALVAALSVISVKTNKICSPEFYTFDAVQLVKVLTVALLSVIVTYAIFMMFAVLSGRRWHYIVLSFVAGNTLFGIVANLIAYANNSIWGVRITDNISWIFSPQIAFLDSMDAEKVLKYVIVLIIQFILVYVVGYNIFKKRKAEIAEASVSGKIIPTIIFVCYLLSVSCSCLAMVDSSIFAKIGVSVAVTVVVSIIITAIFRHKAFTKKSAKCLIGTLAAVLIIIAAVEFLPNIKYKNYVPAASEVESIVFDEKAGALELDTITSQVFETLMFNFEGSSIFGDNYTTYNFSGEEAKAKVEALHKKFIEQSTIDNHGSEDYYYHGSYSVKITYNLKNGKTVERFYDVCSKDIYDEYIALMQTEEALRQTPQLSYKEGDILFIGIMDHRIDFDKWDYSDDYDPFTPSEYLTLDEYDTLFDNIVKDKENEPRDVFEALDQNEAFMIYDPDNHYRDQGVFGLGFDALLNGEYDDLEWEDSEEDNYYPDYHDISIVVYGFYNNVTDEIKEKVAGMTPEELMEYEAQYELSGKGYIIAENYIHINLESDTNTVAYLKSLGLIK